MNTHSTRPQTFPHLATIENTAKYFADAGLTPAAIRAHIFKANDRFAASGQKIPGNGLAKSGAIIRKGRKILIDIDKFGAWLANSHSA